ncbi:MAG TPA: trypsin-like peptidase domain-containing protein [Pseudomonadales bacterium]|nr:trypsin-like peptidase domain-containing protein [Pseudomonadales bacterium]
MNFRQFSKDLVLPALFGLVLASLYLQHQQLLDLEARLAAREVPEKSLPAVATETVVTSYAEAVERALPAVVSISTRKIVRETIKFSNPFLQQLIEKNFSKQALPHRDRVEGSLGSGVIVTSSGYVLTNFHVIADAQEIQVTLYDGHDAIAKIIGVDRETDLAVLKIDMPDLHSIAFADPQHARIGDVALAIGNPFGVGQTVTQGIISAAARYGLELSIEENYLQTDAAINQGNSGGALIDAHGDLLGINTAIETPTGGSVGIGYAIPADTAQKVLNDIIEHGHVVRGWLGIESLAVPEYAAHELGLSKGQGIVVRAVYPGGPADEAGLQAGDVITHFDDVPAMATRAGMKRIAHAAPGEKIQVQYIRGRLQSRATVVIAPRPTR